jgi:hypothetical protein
VHAEIAVVIEAVAADVAVVVVAERPKRRNGSP